MSLIPEWESEMRLSYGFATKVVFQRRQRCDKRELVITLVRSSNNNHFVAVYLITKEFASCRKSFDGPMRNVYGRLLIYGGELLNRGREI